MADTIIKEEKPFSGAMTQLDKYILRQIIEMFIMGVCVLRLLFLPLIRLLLLSNRFHCLEYLSM